MKIEKGLFMILRLWRNCKGEESCLGISLGKRKITEGTLNQFQ